ncbi:MAG: cache domain-containing protein, partial [Gammaproteobacteria bacterium]|nr:cache domain-containing protein [Gammaproteobacteria bacterium]
MITSLKTKIILLIAIIMAITAGGIMFSTHRYVGRAMLQAEEASARNVLELVELNISAGYKRLVADKIEILERLRSDLKDVSAIAASVAGAYIALGDQGRLSVENAQNTALASIRSVQLDKGELLVFDRAGTVIAHPNPLLEGTSIAGARDLKGRSLAEIVDDDGLTADRHYAVFSWKANQDPSTTRKMGYFVPIPEWNWVLGSIVDFRDIEAESQERMLTIIDELRDSFANVRIANTGYAFLFDGEKNMLIAPRETEMQAQRFVNSNSGNLLLDDLMAAAKQQDKSIQYVDPYSKSQDVVETYINHFRAFDWYFGVAVPVREIEAPAQALVTRQSLIIAMIFLGSLIAAYLLVRRISRPLDRLADHAKELASHDFTIQDDEERSIEELPVKYRDEVGRLAEAFVRM